jgi:hypothetical protein
MKRLALLLLVAGAALGLACQSESYDSAQAAIAQVAQSSGYVHVVHY